MNTAQQEPPQDQQEPPQGNGKSSACDLEEIEHLACKAKRFARQAEVMNEQEVKDLDTYRTQYAEARQKYSDARNDAKAELDAIWKILNEIGEQLKHKCRLKPGQEECLYEAAKKVFAEIDKCSDDQTGCASPCDDTPETDPESYTDATALAAEIARRRTNLADVAARFKQLIGEPDEIKKNVSSLKTKAEELNTAVKAGGDNTKVVSWFARWLILKYWAMPKRAWHGFDSVAAFLDCLCGLLKCLISGWTLVAILEGRKAQLDCEDDAKKKACQKKKDDTLQAILEAYEECWKTGQESKTPAQDEESSSGSDKPQSGNQEPTQGDPPQDPWQGPKTETY